MSASATQGNHKRLQQSLYTYTHSTHGLVTTVN